MLLRIFVILLMATGLAGFGTAAWFYAHPALTPASPGLRHVPSPAQTVFILTAAKALRAGALIKPGDLVAHRRDQGSATEPQTGVIADSPINRSSIVGAMMRRSLAADEPVLSSDIMRSGDHGFLAAVLAPGTGAVSVSTDFVAGNAGLIWPGDRVDLILTQTLSRPGIPDGHAVASELVLADMRVVAVDQLLEHGVAPAAQPAGQERVVTFEATVEQAQRINVASRLGRLSLDVRSADQSGQSARATPPATLWASDVSPALRPVRPRNAIGGSVLRIYQGAAESKEFRF